MSDPRIVAANLFDRAILDGQDEKSAPFLPLPLNLIALIISHLDRPSDLSRTCRTCRIFHYIALPQLYSNVTLTSYDKIRYNERDGRPEGCGMSSPFSMGLNGLVSRHVAGYVKSFAVTGDWKEYELEEHAKVGRVPDGSMMMNSLVRVAVDRMSVLENFRWDLDTKMLPTVWQALSQSKMLTSLTMKFPSRRLPRPVCLAPSIPNLQRLRITDIDPLCYPDDIAHLLYGSRSLRHLEFHWSPRMRSSREPSTNVASYFGKIDSSNYLVPLKSMAIQNLYTFDSGMCGNIIKDDLIEEITLLNSSHGLDDDGSMSFMHNSWGAAPINAYPRLKMLRVDKTTRPQAEFIGSIHGLERLYLVSNISNTNHVSAVPTPPKSATPSPKDPPLTNGDTPTSTPSSSQRSPPFFSSTCLQSLKPIFLDAIINNHGPTLRHLLLLPQWRLTADDISRIIRSCPNLEQLAFGTEFENFKHLRLLVPFLPKLKVLRFLPGGNDDDNNDDDNNDDDNNDDDNNDDDDNDNANNSKGGGRECHASVSGGRFLAMMRELDAKGLHMDKIGEECVNDQWSSMRYMELGGPDLIFEIGKKFVVEGTGERRREVTRRRIEDVRHVDIWRMDSIDI